MGVNITGPCKVFLRFDAERKAPLEVTLHEEGGTRPVVATGERVGYETLSWNTRGYAGEDQEESPFDIVEVLAPEPAPVPPTDFLSLIPEGETRVARLGCGDLVAVREDFGSYPIASVADLSLDWTARGLWVDLDERDDPRDIVEILPFPDVPAYLASLGNPLPGIPEFERDAHAAEIKRLTARIAELEPKPVEPEAPKAGEPAPEPLIDGPGEYPMKGGGSVFILSWAYDRKEWHGKHSGIYSYWREDGRLFVDRESDADIVGPRIEPKPEKIEAAATFEGPLSPGEWWVESTTDPTKRYVAEVAWAETEKLFRVKWSAPVSHDPARSFGLTRYAFADGRFEDRALPWRITRPVVRKRVPLDAENLSLVRDKWFRRKECRAVSYPVLLFDERRGLPHIDGSYRNAEQLAEHWECVDGTPLFTEEPV